MLKRTCSPGYTKTHSRIMQGVPRIAAFDQHKALAVTQEVKEHHRERANAIAQKLADIAWSGWGHAAWIASV